MQTMRSAKIPLYDNLSVPVRSCHKVKEILQEEEDLSEIVQLVGKASKRLLFLGNKTNWKCFIGKDLVLRV